jgi:hypothetical protein
MDFLLEYSLLFIAVSLGVLAYFLLASLDLHWGACLAVALLPLAATFFIGVYGLLGSAVAIGGMYKAAGAARR